LSAYDVSCVVLTLSSAISVPLRPPRSPLFPYTTLFRSEISRGNSRIPKPYSDLNHCRSASSRVTNDMGVSKNWAAKREWFKSERSEEHTSELQSRENLVCRLLLEKKKHGQ